MAAFLLRRLLSSVPVAFGVLVLVFVVLHAAPGDPVDVLVPPDELGGSGPDAAATRERIRHELGLDRPVYEQFASFTWAAAHLDFGKSYRTNRLISDDLLQRLPNTFELGMFALAIAYALGIPIGIVSAIKRKTWIDHSSMLGALAGVSVPSFWLGYLLMLLFGLTLRWLPISGQGGPLWEVDGLRHLIMPGVALATGPLALVARLMRSGMLDALARDYIVTARAKGLGGKAIIIRHALRNAAMSNIAIIGIQFGSLLSGAFVIESVFAWPGLGRYAVDAISGRDYPAVQATVILVAFMYVLGNVFSDALHALVDPRIRLES